MRSGLSALGRVQSEADLAVTTAMAVKRPYGLGGKRKAADSGGLGAAARPAMAPV